MRPVLLSVFGIDVQTYGVSKALAAWVAALLLGRAFERRGIGSRQQAYSLVMWSTVWGFAGAKVYYLLEQAPSLTMHDFGGMGFTWEVDCHLYYRRSRQLGLVAGAPKVWKVRRAHRGRGGGHPHGAAVGPPARPRGRRDGRAVVRGVRHRAPGLSSFR